MSRRAYTVTEESGAHEPATVHAWHEADAAEAAVDAWYSWAGEPYPYHADVVVTGGGDSAVRLRVHLSTRLHVHAEERSA